ncbi:hypothetical protein QBC40DRAFT_252985 [Triangularia verruculosa]|uniref:Protein-ribulosamine 3-kinase n=1 Tax=Triangularia verruculosa TaxID=2587418 RepID=A0AAN6XLR1_9PEZI|nr:hypothetical protein QBC40DRAFT_252985 [Triangularia verruculosa]
MAQSGRDVSGMSNSQKHKLDDEHRQWIENDRFGINDKRALHTRRGELDIQDTDIANGFVTGVIRVLGTKEKRYRLKYCYQKEARNAVLAMYQATMLLRKILPWNTSPLIGYAPRRINRDRNLYSDGWKPEEHCLLEGWQYICERTPTHMELIPNVVDLHEKEIPSHFHSGWGKFGSPTAWYDGAVAQWFPMHDNWADCFKEGLRLTIQKEKKIHGEDPVFNHLCREILDRVVDRLLVPMESHGRSVTPTLVHGNLWDKTVKSRGGRFSAPVLMDATPLLAPYEYEWAPWWSQTNKIDFNYIDAYLWFSRCKILEPVYE